MEIITTTTQDGLILHGLLAKPSAQAKGLILHIHGMAGDFYVNSYYPHMYAEYPAQGWAFLAVEQRGTGVITDFLTQDGNIRSIGNAQERFEECVYDIDAWVTKAQDLGYKNIWLQAHSLGPSKVAYYMDKTHDSRVGGLVFISPTDMIGLVHDPVGIKDHQLLLSEAESLVAEGKSDQLLSRPFWGTQKLTAGTYLNFFGNGAKTAIFNFNDLGLGWEVVNRLDRPVLAITGTKDEGIVTVKDAYAAMQQLESELKHCPRVKTVVYEEADHDFTGFDKQIVRDVIEFIS